MERSEEMFKCLQENGLEEFNERYVLTESIFGKKLNSKQIEIKNMDDAELLKEYVSHLKSDKLLILSKDYIMVDALKLPPVPATNYVGKQEHKYITVDGVKLLGFYIGEQLKSVQYPVINASFDPYHKKVTKIPDVYTDSVDKIRKILIDKFK